MLHGVVVEGATEAGGEAEDLPTIPPTPLRISGCIDDPLLLPPHLLDYAMPTIPWEDKGASSFLLTGQLISFAHCVVPKRGRTDLPLQGLGAVLAA